jgi:hypothetical protein
LQNNSYFPVFEEGSLQFTFTPWIQLSCLLFLLLIWLYFLAVNVTGQVLKALNDSTTTTIGYSFDPTLPVSFWSLS